MGNFDTTWKVAIEKHCREFFEFFFPAVAAGLDWSCKPVMLNQELQAFAPESQSGRMHADCLMRLKLLDGTDFYVLVHIEVQSQYDPLFAERMASYHWRIRDHYRTDRVCSLAILGDRRPDWKPDHYESAWLGCRLRLDFPICKLADLPEWPERRGNPFAWLVAAHRLAQRHGKNSLRRRDAKFGLVRQLYQELPPQQIREFFNLVDGVLALSKNLRYDFWQELRQFEEEQQMVYLNSIERLILEEARAEAKAEGKAEGMAEGMAEGEVVGRVQGLRLALCRSARARWGLDVAAEVESKTEPEQLEGLLEALVTSESPDSWLKHLRG